MTRHSQHPQKTSIKPLITALGFAVIAALLHGSAYLIKSQELNLPFIVSLADNAFIVVATLSGVLFLRWLIADAPFNVLKRYTFAPLLKTFTSLILTFGAILFLLNMLLGVNVLSLFTTSAVLTGIIALSMQDTFKNLFTGLWINMERIVAKGDWVRIADKEGKVMEVTWRTTRLQTRENDYIFIPNRILADGILENYTFPSPAHIIVVTVSASYKDPPNKVKDLLYEVALSAKGVVDDPAPVIWITGYGDFSVHYSVRASISDFKLAPYIYSDISTAIWYAFRRNNIEMPYPVRTIYHRKTEVQPDTDIAGILKSIDFLNALDDDAIAAVADYSRLEVFGHNEAVVRENEAGHTCYYIIRGSVDITHRGSTNKDTHIAALATGGLFGEMSLLTGEKRNATVTAKEDTVCLVIDSGAFKRIFNEHPQMAARLSELLAKRRAEHHDSKTKAAARPDALKDDENNILAGIKRFFKID